MYKKKGLKFLIIAFFNIWFSKNSTFIFKIIFPFIVFAEIITLGLIKVEDKLKIKKQ